MIDDPSDWRDLFEDRSAMRQYDGFFYPLGDGGARLGELQKVKLAPVEPTPIALSSTTAPGRE
jgi:hypothetical protein